MVEGKKDTVFLKEGLFTYPGVPGEGPKLIGGRCRDCQAYFFPKRYLCPHCHKEGTIEEVELSSRGKLYTYCVVRVAPEGFTAPYVLGYVDLPEGVRIFTPITDVDPSALQIGMELELVIAPLRQDTEGNDIVGYKFRPV
jgi:uncharacterized OB-fold protein